jgi:O-acetyl-ADP-ribose deacetylase (regulator of RNase III)
VSLEFRTGNLFAVRAEALVVPTNCLGANGAGLARAAARCFPTAMGFYSASCRAGRVRPGVVVPYDYWATAGPTVRPASYPRYVVCVPTKDDWRKPSELAYVQAGATALAAWALAVDAGSVAVPALGCGLGGLAWDDVRPALEEALRQAPGVRWLVFAPGPA